MVSKSWYASSRVTFPRLSDPSQGEENVGMAMTFTLVSHLREQLAELVRSRAENERRLATEKERLELEVGHPLSLPSCEWRLTASSDQVEEAKTRGTPVTRESFLAWEAKFDKEMGAKRAKEQEERLKSLTPKEREEHKKFQGRFSGAIIFLSPPRVIAEALPGRQLFERSKDWTEDESLEEDGTSVDVTQYERARQTEEEAEGDHIYFSDSD